MPSFLLHIKGRVQGVGFRPFVYSLASQYNIKGWVRNDIDGVRIKFNAQDQSKVNQFVQSVLEQAPVLSIIKKHSIHPVKDEEFSSFYIEESSSLGKANMLISPDFAICKNCLEDLENKSNRRYRYAFITCTVCGPRYSIIDALPYDRSQTRMKTFEMCIHCKSEYNNVKDRRYYSQTNSCPDCPVRLTLWNNKKEIISTNQNEILEITRTKLYKENSIIAVKAIGGFLLLGNACDEDLVKRLRARKHRDAKPFAVMYPSLDIMGNDVELTAHQLNLLNSEVSPIVLAKVRQERLTEIPMNEIAPGLHYLGVMVPYSGLLKLLIRGFTRPLIATSGNISHAPICYDNVDALNSLSGIADYILINDRDIVMPQDDSVIRFSTKYHKQIILRRSRGLAPSFRKNPVPLNDEYNLIAFGADLKSSFSILHNGELYTSQYLGDLSDYRSELSFKDTLNHLEKVLKCNPDTILADSHPDYTSTRVAHSYAIEKGVNVNQVQHHKSHLAAVLAENELLDSDEKILGVIWDGTGYGDDKQIWGGEFFQYKDYTVSRIDHVPYFPHLSADKMAREPRLSCYSVFRKHRNLQPYLKSKFSEKEWDIYTHLTDNYSQLLTSSMGRIFDGVASLLGFTDFNHYEGQAAMLLEAAAERYINEYGIPILYPEPGNNKMDLTGLLTNMGEYFLQDKDKDYCAAMFHVSLVDWIWTIASKHQYKHVAFSGGVFQNALLVDLILEKLSKKLTLNFHKELSPNDENISYGQIASYYIDVRASEYAVKKHLILNY